jgi:hypothetical protein
MTTVGSPPAVAERGSTGAAADAGWRSVERSVGADGR